MDLESLCAGLALPLTEVKSTGFVDGKMERKSGCLNIEAGAKMVRMLCTTYKDPQEPLKCLEALATKMILLNANLANDADSVSPFLMEKLNDNP